MASEGYLVKYGARLIDAGYNIIPIPPGAKLPVEPEWQKTEPSKTLLKSWLDPKRRHPTTDNLSHYDRAGVGIITEKTPAVDIDIKDAEISSALERFVFDLIGQGPVRIGRAPKRLILCRTDEPFRKLQTAAFIRDPADTEDKGQRVEILCKGQQFVAYAIHPNTGKPYDWPNGDGPAGFPADELPVLNLADAQKIIVEAERLMTEAGWERKRARRENEIVTLGKIDYDNPFASDKHKADISDDELHAKLLMIPNDDEDYDTWLQIGMALWHQYDGSDFGLETWLQWSEQSSKHSTEYCEQKWQSFDIDAKGREPITARYILKLASEYAEKIAVETYREVVEALKVAATREQFLEICTKIKKTEFDNFQRQTLLGLVKDNFKRITNYNLSVTDARSFIKYENPKVSKTPFWLENWVYIEIDETFYSLKRRISLTVTAFNQVHSRFLLTRLDVLEGRSVPEQVPSQVALNLYQIPIAHNRMYMPGEEDLFSVNGVQYVNRYTDLGVPAIPEFLTARDRRNQARIMHHFEHLFTDPRERRTLVDVLAYIVQTGKRINWCLLMVGAQGDGKSFFALALMAMLGMENVKTIPASAIEEKNNAWAEGSQVVFIEEIKLVGHNRHDILNKIKPLITNPVVPIRRMHTDWYDVLNTSTYMATSNFRDAMPLTEQDNRYYVMFTRFQTKAQVDAFNLGHPTYYDDLHEALAQSPGAIRQLFLEWEVSPTFRAMGRAPDSRSRVEMIELEKSEEIDVLDEILAECGRPDMSAELLNSTDLGDEMSSRGAVVPYGKALNKMLTSRGFSPLGKFRKGEKTVRFWSQKPAMFRDELGIVTPERIKQYFEDEAL